jgi:hypothetical protein
MTKQELSKDTKKTGVSRRNFLTTAAAVTADYDAVAVHLADQGRLPRVRP